MNRFFTTLIASAMVLGASAQNLNFEEYESDPQQGVVPDLSMISVLFPNVAEIEIISEESIYLMKNFEEVPGTNVQVFDDNLIRMSLPERITEAGEYIMMIGAEALRGYNGDRSESIVNENEIYLTFNIEGSQTELNFDFTSDPVQGTVQSLSTVTLTFPNIYDLEFNDRKGVAMTRNGAPAGDVSMSINSSEQLVITLAEPVTDPGEYKITVNTGALTGFSISYAFLDNPEPIEVSYVIEGAAEQLDFSFTAFPANGSTVTGLSDVTLRFPALDNADTLTDDVLVTVGDITLTNDQYSVELTDGNMFAISFMEPLTAETLTPVRIFFAPGTIMGRKGEVNASNANPIELNYQLAPAVKEDLVITFNRPTLPNSDGELSAELQIDSFFFMVEGVKDLNAATGTEDNVSIKFNNEAEVWEQYSRLRKGFGFNAENSYFSAPISNAPYFNGDYIVTIAAHSIGDSTWLENHEFGHTNPETILHFTLVDGDTVGIEKVEAIEADAAEIYTLQGIRVNCDVNKLPAGFYVVNGKVVIKK